LTFAFTLVLLLLTTEASKGNKASQGHEWLKHIEFSHLQLPPPYARDPGLVVAEKLTHRCRLKSGRPGSNRDFAPQHHTHHLKDF
jgi:hypothetical protein